MRPKTTNGGSIVAWQLRSQSTDSGDVGTERDGSAGGQASTEAPGPGGAAGPTDGGADEDGSDEADELPLDQVFEILKNSRRRQTLHFLRENGGEASLSDLAEHIAAIENDVSVDALTSSQRKRVYVGLYQCHLPKMDDMNIIDFEKNRGTVELAANAEQMEPYLEDDDGTDWYRLYASVTAVGIGLFAASTLGSAPLGLTPATVLGALLAVMALCSLAHVYVERWADSSVDD